MNTLSTGDIEALMEQFRRAGWQELHVRLGNVDLFLSADGTAPSTARPPAFATTAAHPGAPTPAEAPTRRSRSRGLTVVAPGLGTFHRAAEAGAPACADIGMSVTAESALGAIEVMNAFTPLRSGVAGTVREIYVNDGELVEFEQPLFLIEPHA